MECSCKVYIVDVNCRAANNDPDIASGPIVDVSPPVQPVSNDCHLQTAAVTGSIAGIYSR